jgi:acetylornithine aminotransferase
VGGIAVNSLGTGHPAVVRAVSDQVATLGHVSNLFSAEPTIALAERLLALAGRPGAVYFGNSGAEAVEAAVKLGRRTGRPHMVATAGGFHGRTMGALALTGQLLAIHLVVSLMLRPPGFARTPVDDREVRP